MYIVVSSFYVWDFGFNYFHAVVPLSITFLNESHFHAQVRSCLQEMLRCFLLLLTATGVDSEQVCKADCLIKNNYNLM